MGVLVLRLTLKYAEVFSYGEKTGHVSFSVKSKKQNKTFFTPQMNIFTGSQKIDTTFFLQGKYHVVKNY